MFYFNVFCLTYWIHVISIVIVGISWRYPGFAYAIENKSFLPNDLFRYSKVSFHIFPLFWTCLSLSTQACAGFLRVPQPGRTYSDANRKISSPKNCMVWFYSKQSKTFATHRAKRHGSKGHVLTLALHENETSLKMLCGFP